MKVLFVLAAFALFVGVYADSLVEEVTRTMETMALVNKLKRGLHATEDSNRGCPLARYHNKRDSMETDEQSYNFLSAVNVLREAGFTSDQLNSKEVLEVFARQTTAVCQSDTNTTVNCTAHDDNYRTADGRCNNVDNPSWGRAFVDQTRWLAADYDDDTDPNSVRNTSADGGPLPHPRDISNAVHYTNVANTLSSTINLHVFQMGQFLDHDITDTPMQGAESDCCGNPTQTALCLPIFFQEDDTDETAGGNALFTQGYCINFQRSTPSSCITSPRQQQNAITSYVDASNVYGSSTDETTKLRRKRTESNGDRVALAKMRSPGGRLPRARGGACKDNGVAGANCTLAGDHRSSVVPSLSVYHGMFVLLHNLIVDELGTSGSLTEAEEETLFQDARRILIAIWQKIIYDEFLPAILSSAIMDTYALNNSNTYTYDSSINPGMMQGFGIGYRIGHTWIPKRMEIFDELFSFVQGNDTEDTFEDVHLYNLDARGLALWLTGDLSEDTDPAMVEAVRSRLFQSATSASDLAALNIQRGRDHGVPSYADYYAECSGTAPLDGNSDFSDLPALTSECRTAFESVYADPRDVDLFPGLMCEKTVESGKFSHTAGCIIAEQFSRVKYGDRYFYQNGDQPNPFSTAELAEIDSWSLARVLCAVYDFDTVDSNAFLFDTDRVACSTLDGTSTLSIFASSGTKRNAGSGTAAAMSGGSAKSLSEILKQKEVEVVLEKLIEELDDE